MIEATRRSFLETTLLSACGLSGSAWARAVPSLAPRTSYANIRKLTAGLG